MQCVPGITTPIMLVDSGKAVNCSSNDGAQCLWGSCPAVTAGTKPFGMTCPGWESTTHGVFACTLLEEAAAARKQHGDGQAAGGVALSTMLLLGAALYVVGGIALGSGAAASAA